MLKLCKELISQDYGYHWTLGDSEDVSYGEFWNSAMSNGLYGDNNNKNNMNDEEHCNEL